MPMLIAALFWMQSAPALEGFDSEAFLEEIIDETGTPAAAVIVVGPDGPLIIDVEGVRQVGATEEAEASDAWHIGSNAKSMTATLAMVMVEEGAITLDDDVRSVLGERFKVDPAWSDVTLRQLLSHRGGVEPNVGTLTFLRYAFLPSKGDNGPRKDRRQVLKGVLRKPPSAEPGTEYQYSNLGITLAGAMLEERAGQPFEALIEERLFQPLGMDGAVLGAPTGEEGTVIFGHREDPPEAAPEGADNPAFMSPAGTYSFDLDSYAAYLTDQLRGQLTLEGTLLTAASYEALATAPDDLRDYGLGWGLREDGSLRHSGSNTMWFVTTIVSPNHELAVSVLTNYGEVRGLGEAIDEVLALKVNDETALAP